MKTLDNGLFPALNVNISFRSVKSLVFKQDGNNFPPSFKYLRRTLESTTFPYGRPSSLQMYRVYPGDEYQIYLGGRGGGWSLPPTAMSPAAHPLSTFETKMAVRNGKRTMSTILRKKKKGLWLVCFFLENDAMAGPSLKVLGPKEILSLQELTMDTCEVILTFESVDEILWCCHSSETSSAVLSHGTIYLLSSSNV